MNFDTFYFQSIDSILTARVKKELQYLDVLTMLEWIFDLTSIFYLKFHSENELKYKKNIHFGLLQAFGQYLKD